MAESELQSLSVSLFDTPKKKTDSVTPSNDKKLIDVIKKACADKNFVVLKYIL